MRTMRVNRRLEGQRKARRQRLKQIDTSLLVRFVYEALVEPLPLRFKRRQVLRLETITRNQLRELKRSAR